MGRSRKRRFSWKGIAIAEALILVFSYVYTGRRHRYSEPNAIARLFLDDPGFVESLLFYFVTLHVLIALFLVAATVARRWKERLEELGAEGRRPIHNLEDGGGGTAAGGGA